MSKVGSSGAVVDVLPTIDPQPYRKYTNKWSIEFKIVHDPYILVKRNSHGNRHVRELAPSVVTVQVVGICHPSYLLDPLHLD